MRMHPLALLASAGLAATGLAAAGLGSPASAQTATQARTRPAYEVTIHVKNDRPQVGGKVVVTGLVRPGSGAAGESIVLQQRANKTVPWHETARSTVHDDGTYKLVDLPTTGTTRQYRVRKPADTRHREGISAFVNVSVYSWRHLDATYADGGDGTISYNMTSHLDAETYGHSLRPYYANDLSKDHPGEVDFTLDGLCRKMRGTFGLDDDSEAPAQVDVQVLSDTDGTLYDETFGITEHEKKGLVLDDPQTLAVTMTALTDDYTIGAVGRAEVLCTE